MSGIMQKTYPESYFAVISLNGRYSMKRIEKEGYEVIQVMPVGENHVLVELIERGWYAVRKDKEESK